MRISRIEVESPTGEARTFALHPQATTFDESPTDTERLLSVFRNLYLGIKRRCRIFAVIDNVELEITDEMVPLIGQRLAGEFRVLDLAVPPPIATDPTDIRDVQAVVARAALETLGVVLPTLDAERIDQAVLAVDRYRDPLANDAHASYLRTTGLLQLFSRRSGRELLDPEDPVVARLARFDDTLTDRRRQISSSAPPLPDEVERATGTLRELVSARMGGIPPENAATMSQEAVESDIAQWVIQQHDRQLTPIITESLSRHAEGIHVVGSIPVVLDLRRVQGFPPGGDAIRWASREHGDELQFIVLVGSPESRLWIENTVASSVS